jgi:Rho family protein
LLYYFSAELLLTTQLYNAPQLSAWCLHFISSNYLAYHQQDSFSQLTGDNMDYVEQHRWPPVSYEVAMEEYKKKYVEEEKEKAEVKQRKRFKFPKLLRRNVSAL